MMVKTYLPASILAFFVSGCASVSTPVGPGFLVTNVKGPVAVGSVTAGEKRVGKACAASYLGLVAAGNASIDKAKEQAGIIEVASVDHSSFSFLVLYSRYCTIVTGT